MKTTTLTRERFATPVGALTIALHHDRLCAAGFDEQWPALERGLARRFGAIEFRDAPRSKTGARIAAYLAGDLGALDDVAVDAGGTEFQRAVWDALRCIPVGATTSYGDIARALGNARAVRAVGRANALNPISVVVPCHRVVRGDGDLCGYAGGLARKRWLLEHERAINPRA
jgi:methylated-DNA-[protein]-cysteine S-methyltransferase